MKATKLSISLDAALGVEVRAAARRAGKSVSTWVAEAARVLLGRAGTSDAIAATVVLAAEDGDRIVTSDPVDIGRLAVSANRRVAVVAC